MFEKMTNDQLDTELRHIDIQEMNIRNSIKKLNREMEECFTKKHQILKEISNRTHKVSDLFSQLVIPGAIIRVASNGKGIKKVISVTSSVIICGDIGRGFAAKKKNGRYTHAIVNTSFDESYHPMYNVYDYTKSSVLGVFVKSIEDEYRYDYIRVK